LQFSNPDYKKVIQININISECGAVVLKERVCWDEGSCENPVMTFPIKKRINTELFIDRMATLNQRQ